MSTPLGHETGFLVGLAQRGADGKIVAWSKLPPGNATWLLCWRRVGALRAARRRRRAVHRGRWGRHPRSGEQDEDGRGAFVPLDHRHPARAVAAAGRDAGGDRGDVVGEGMQPRGSVPAAPWGRGCRRTGSCSRFHPVGRYGTGDVVGVVENPVEPWRRCRRHGSGSSTGRLGARSGGDLAGWVEGGW